MAKIAALAYGIVVYLLFLVTVVYMIGFLGSNVVPEAWLGTLEKWIPNHADRKMGSSDFGVALIVNALLIVVFGVQHSLMARDWFKKKIAGCGCSAVERSTYVLLSCAALWLLFWQWRPIHEAAWDYTLPGKSPAIANALKITFWVGWGLVAVSFFAFNHLGFLGLKQVLCNLKGEPYTPPAPRGGPLRAVFAHPSLLAFMLALWATPRMALGHIVFSLGMTLYMLVAMKLADSARSNVTKTAPVAPPAA